MTMKDGGPAFPWCGDLNECPTINLGMTLRDWFAGQALAGTTANTEESKGSKGLSYQSDLRTTAKIAYDLADAMLAARMTDDELTQRVRS